MKEEKKEVSEKINFACETLGISVPVLRKTLVASIQAEARKYANHAFSVKNSEGKEVTSFNIPELEKQLPKGFSIGIVINLPSNSGTRGSKKDKAML